MVIFLYNKFLEGGIKQFEIEKTLVKLLKQYISRWIYLFTKDTYLSEDDYTKILLLIFYPNIKRIIFKS